MSATSSAEIDTLDDLDDPAQPPRSVLPSASPWFVALCMVVIAGSLATLLYLRAGLSVAESGWIGFAALLIMVLAEFYSARARERSAVEAELLEVVRVSNAYKSEVAALGERVADIETTLTIRIDAMIEERAEPIAADLQRLDERIDALAETVAEIARPPAPAAGAAAIDPDDPAGEGAGPGDPGWAFPGMTEAEAAAMIKRVTEEQGPDIHLQSIVSLPQRRIRFYEALARLRTGNGRALLPAQFIPVAERSGIMPLVDNAVLFRAAKILRKVGRKNSDVGVFCNISARSLSNAGFFQPFVDFMSENGALAGSIVFEFDQAAFDDLGPVELANLEGLTELGYRFSLDNVTRLDLDGATLAARGVRYVKVDAATLLSPPSAAAARIHAADLAALLARSGITLIATRVETESQVVDILDYDVKFGQGNLFAAPRLVRADVAHASRRGAGL